MDSYDHFFAHQLKKRIEEAVLDLTEVVLSGHSPERYMRLVGAHDAYRNVLTLMEEVRRDLNSPDQTKRNV